LCIIETMANHYELALGLYMKDSDGNVYDDAIHEQYMLDNKDRIYSIVTNIFNDDIKVVNVEFDKYSPLLIIIDVLCDLDLDVFTSQMDSLFNDDDLKGDTWLEGDVGLDHVPGIDNDVHDHNNNNHDSNTYIYLDTQLDLSEITFIK